MTAETSKRRLPGLDLLKVLALYLVILYHLTFRHPANVLTGGLGDYLVYALTTLMSICVPLFFTISGALCLRKPIDLAKNTRRAAQILFLALFWAFASLLIVLKLRGETMSVKEFFTVAFELRVGYIQHLWYLPAFFFLCLFAPILQALQNGTPKVYRYFLLLLFIMTFGDLLLSDLEYLLRWMTGHLSHTGNREFFWYTNFFSYHYWYAVIYFALGAFLTEHAHWLCRYRKTAAILIPVSVFFLTLFALARSHVLGAVFDPVFNNYGSVFTLILTASVTLLLQSCHPGKPVRRILASIASCSLGIYLIHWLLIEVILDYFPSVEKTVALSPLTALVLLALSWGITWCCSKIPLVKNLFTAAPAWIHGKKS